MNIDIRIIRDENADSPREWDNLGVMACWHRRYLLGDVRPECDPAEWLAENAPEGSIVLSLYLYDHGDISLSTTPFGCRFDSGWLGFIVATPDKIQEAYGSLAQDALEMAKDGLLAEVKVYNDFVSGNVWGFVVEEIHRCAHCEGERDKKVVESCFGFFGDGAVEDMKDYIDLEHRPLLHKAWEDRFSR